MSLVILKSHLRDTLCHINFLFPILQLNLVLLRLSCNFPIFKENLKQMIKKTVANVQEATKGVKDGMTFMLGGFGLCGIPENAITELVEKNIKDITCISNNAGVDDFGLGLLLKKKADKKNDFFLCG